MNRLTAVPLELNRANAFVAANHRHHPPVHRDKFRCGAIDENGVLHGVVQIARPVSRMLDDGQTCEIVRLCTDGYENACSFLYSRAAQAAKALGYRKIITYILCSEDGASLKAVGFSKDCDTGGGTWSRPSRIRYGIAPTCPKQRYSQILNVTNQDKKG